MQMKICKKYNKNYKMIIEKNKKENKMKTKGGN